MCHLLKNRNFLDRKAQFKLKYIYVDIQYILYIYICIYTVYLFVYIFNSLGNYLKITDLQSVKQKSQTFHQCWYLYQIIFKDDFLSFGIFDIFLFCFVFCLSSCKFRKVRTFSPAAGRYWTTGIFFLTPVTAVKSVT